MANSRFKAVMFDFGGVFSRGDIVQLFFDIEKSYDIPHRTIFKLGTKADIGVKLDLGELTFNEAADLLNDLIRNETGIQQFDLAKDLEDIDKDYLQSCSDMEDLARRLRREGLKLAVISNNWKKSQDSDDSYLSVNNGLFDVVIDSCVVHLRKPQTEIFQLALDRLGVSAHQAIFLDDLKENVEGATKLGITGIHVNPKDKKSAISQLADYLQLDLMPEINALT